MKPLDFDYVIIGSGFGGSVSALRLSEKGYKVLIIEKGKWYSAEDFPKTNWNLRKWLWEPKLGLRGFFKMTFLNHVTVLSGVGVGGGSLSYANTLPIPKKTFYNSGSWASLNEWENILKPYYKLAYKMLGAETNKKFHTADQLVKELAGELNMEKKIEGAMVGVFLGKEGQSVKDPYFGGKGPDRSGCIYCGACMTGCRFNAKNTLDKNYLYLAQRSGAEILAETEVFKVAVSGASDGSDGYLIEFRTRAGKKRMGSVTTKGVVFSGGVLGTVPLLLELKETSLPKLSDMVGCNIRTNNESLMLVTSTHKNDTNFSEGLAIGSVLHVDENSHVEPTRFGSGSGFFRALTMPMMANKFVLFRLMGVLGLLIRRPVRFVKTIFTSKYASRTTILLWMQTLDSTLSLRRGKLTKMKTKRENGPKPTAFIPEAHAFSKKYAKKVKGIPFANFIDVLVGTPTTAHILGGSVMGKDPLLGVIDKKCKVFGYKNMLVCDGSMISANPGVNPSLTITAISEYAMSEIEDKKFHPNFNTDDQ